MNRQWIYARRPEGAVTTDIFELQLTDLPQPAPGEALVRVKIISVDPANRAYDPQRYRPDQIRIQGKLAGLLRRY